MNSATPLFDSKGEPRPALLELLTLFNVSNDGTLNGIRDATQSAWYQAGKLRAEIAEQHADRRAEAMDLFSRLGLVDEINPREKYYLHAVIPGATIVAVRKRLAFLSACWKDMTYFTQIVLLGGQRSLMKDKESDAILLDANNGELPFQVGWTYPHLELPKTEADMMKLVMDQSQFPWPSSMKKVFVNAPLQNGRNPMTADTVREWLKLGPNVAPCLVVSSQPFVYYQHLIFSKLLPPGFEVETVGYRAPESTPVTVYLDNIAKIIFELAS